MAGNLTGLHIFANDVSPEPLALLDTNYGAINSAFNALANFSNYYVDSGAANLLLVTVTPNQTVAYSDGLMLEILVAATNTGAATLNVNNIGPRPIVDLAGNPLTAGTLLGGSVILVIFRLSANNFQLLGGSSVVSSPNFNATVTINPVGGRQSLVVYGATSQYTQTIHASSTVGGSYGLAISAGTNASDVAFSVGNQANTATMLAVFGDGHGWIGPEFTNSLQWNTTGNFIMAPASGPYVLRLASDHANGWGLNFNDTNASPQSFDIGLGLGTGAPTLVIYDRTNNAARLTLNGAGNFSIAATASGTGLTVALPGGIKVGAPINPHGNLDIADNAPLLRVQDTGVNQAICEIFATNTAVGFDANWGNNPTPISIRMGGSGGAECIGISTNRQITMGAPASGTALTVNGLVTGLNVACTTVGSTHALIAGPSKGVRIGDTASQATIDGVDPTGIGSYQPLVVTGSTLGLGIGGTPYINIAGNGEVTMNGPGPSLILTPSSGGECARFVQDSGYITFFNSANTTRTGYIQGVAASGMIFSSDLVLPISFAVNGNTRLQINASSPAVAIVGFTAGTAALRINVSAQNGTNSASFSPNNKPGGGNTNVAIWLPINLDGTTYFFPGWL